MTYDELIARYEDEVSDARVAAAGSERHLKSLRSRVANGERLSDDTLQDAIATHERQALALRRAEAKLTQLLREQAEDNRIAELREQPGTDVQPSIRGASTMTDRTYVTAEPSAYSLRAETTGGASYLRDLFASQIKRDPAASERLARHGREMESQGRVSARAVATGTVAAFVPPAYMVEMFAEYARAGRPTANLLTALPLPATGMTIPIPKVTVPTEVGSQSAENAPIANQDLESDTIEVPVGTVAGYVDVSRQALERGVLVEELHAADLASAYNTSLDTQVIAAALAQTGTNVVTYTSTTPTAAELWPKLAEAVGKVKSQRHTGPTAIVMHPLTWAMLAGALDKNDRPLYVSAASGPSNAMGVGQVSDAAVVGQVAGLPVVADGNLPVDLGTGTDETCILVADFRDALIFEDANAAPAQLKFEDVGSATLTVRLLAYGYSAFTFARQPKALSVIGGTGLVVPE